jgi:hypothetical protein
VEEEVVEQQPVEQQPVEQQPVEQQPVEQQPVEQQGVSIGTVFFSHKFSNCVSLVFLQSGFFLGH